MRNLLFILTLLISNSLFAQPDNIQERSQADIDLAPFYHGVASGDPLSDRVIIWTRVTTDLDGPVNVQWRIALDSSFTDTLQEGSIITDASKDYTVKVDVLNLEPNTYYYYEFSADGKNSIRGRTKTTPVDKVDQLRFGIVSCSRYNDGYFNSYEKLYERNDIDAVIHLGDYIYEYAGSELDFRSPEPQQEIVELADYRMRYSSHRLDSDARLMHQNYPFISVWDDHESANNSWRDGAENHDLGEGEWSDRKKASLTAYYEWMPIRLPDANDFNRIWRKISYGGLVDLFMLDTRLYDRDEEVDEGFDDEGRKMLGPVQMQWLEDQLLASTAKWKILGQQVMMGSLKIPILDLTLNPDQWDGYTQERDRLLSFLKDNNIDNTIVLTGDIHTAWAIDLPLSPDDYKGNTGEGSVAVEFVSTSVTTASSPIGFSPDIYGLIRTILPHIKYLNLNKKGYSVLDIKDDRATNNFYVLGSILANQTTDRMETSYYTDAGANHLKKNGQPVLDDRPQQYHAPLHPRVLEIEDTTVVVGVKEQQQFTVLGIYPNPCNNQFVVNINLFDAAKTTIELFDTKGDLMLSRQLKQQNKGLNFETFDITDLAKGNYLLKINGEHQSKTFPIIKI